MGLFDKIKNPVFLKDDSKAEKQLAVLKELKDQAEGKLAEKLDDEIARVDAGIFGEKSVRYELENSHIPMFVLHDLCLEHGGLKAQIDYLIVTHKHVFILECKNLYGNIEITNSGDFIRTRMCGRRTVKEGIYSPITQNRRHLELVKAIRGEAKTGFIKKAIFENAFYETYRTLVVIANPKTVLYDKFAKKEIKNQVIKADGLTEYIRRTDDMCRAAPLSESSMEELARFFLNSHREQRTDYAEKFVKELEEQKKSKVQPSKGEQQIICPKCGSVMVKRIAAKGPNKGKEFYGCSNFPKCRCIINIK